MPRFRSRDNVLLLEVDGWKSGQIVCLSGTTEDSSALCYLLPELLKKVWSAHFELQLAQLIALALPIT